MNPMSKKLKLILLFLFLFVFFLSFERTIGQVQKIVGGYISAPHPPAIPNHIGFYSVTWGANQYIYRYNRQNYQFLSSFQLSDTSMKGASGEPFVLREDKERVFVDSDTNIYLFAYAPSGYSGSRICRYNLLTNDLVCNHETTGSGSMPYNAGYVDGSYIWTVRFVNYAYNCLFKFSLPDLTKVGATGAGIEIPAANGLIVSQEQQYVYIYSYRYDPYYLRVYRFNRLTMGYVDYLTITDGSNETTNKGFVRRGNYIYGIIRNSGTGATGPGGFVKINYPSISYNSRYILPSGAGYSLSVDSDGIYGYLISTYSIKKFRLSDLTEVASYNFGYTINSANSFIDEAEGKIYVVTIDTGGANRFWVFNLSDLSLYYSDVRTFAYGVYFYPN